MSKQNRPIMFHVITENKHGYHFTYEEEAHSAQEAVDNVRRYMDSTETVVSVFRQVNNWK